MPTVTSSAPAVPYTRIREIAEAAMKMDGVLKLYFGESNVPTPEDIKRAAARALEEGYTYYSENAGLPSMRRALLSDRLGTKRALLVFNVVAIAGFLFVILIPAWQAVIAGSVLFVSWSSISLPATVGLIARVLPAGKRTMGVSMHSLVNRIPMALGPILGGFCIAVWGEADGVRWAFGFALLFAVVAIVLQQKMIEEPPATGSGTPTVVADGSPRAMCGAWPRPSSGCWSPTSSSGSANRSPTLSWSSGA